MKLTELITKLHAADLLPIRVEPISSDDLMFVGSLGEFIHSAKVMQSPFVFVSTITLSEEHFLLENPETDDEDEANINVCQIVPELNNFKNRIGEDGQFDLWVPATRTSLRLVIREDWLTRFLELHSQADKLLQQSLFENRAQNEAIEEARAHHLLENLRGLIADSDFIRLPTQRAMLAYALEDFPELESLDERVLKSEIQKLKAKIDAQVSRRK